MKQREYVINSEQSFILMIGKMSHIDLYHYLYLLLGNSMERHLPCEDWKKTGSLWYGVP